MDYSSSNKKKVVLSRSNNLNTPRVDARVLRWENNSAITSIVISRNNASSFLANSTFSLYGIAG
jgi:hypothetical protein